MHPKTPPRPPLEPLLRGGGLFGRVGEEGEVVRVLKYNTVIPVDATYKGGVATSPRAANGR